MGRQGTQPRSQKALLGFLSFTLMTVKRIRLSGAPSCLQEASPPTQVEPGLCSPPASPSNLEQNTEPWAGNGWRALLRTCLPWLTPLPQGFCKGSSHSEPPSTCRVTREGPHQSVSLTQGKKAIKQPNHSAQDTKGATRSHSLLTILEWQCSKWQER
jgi:hypothetical protein